MMGMFGWFKLKGFIILAVLIYGGFIIGDWIVKAIGLEQYGVLGTFLALMLPAVIIYWAWKTWLKPHIQ